MKSNKSHEKPSVSEREQKRRAMLDEALSRPGVRRAMEVYGYWQEQDQGLDPYRTSAKEPYQIITTDHANAQ